MRTKYINAEIYTVDPGLPWAEEMIIEGETIVYIGGPSDLPADVMVDCGGKMIMPSFIDSHAHPGWITQSAWHIPLPKTDQPKVIFEYISEFAEEHDPKEYPFLYFEYYPTEMFGTKGPKKEMLDEVVNDRPCLLQDFSEHMCCVNTKMLELMKIDKDTPDPSELQVYVRDESGNPTGWVKEAAWMSDIDTMYNTIGWRPPIELNQKSMSKYFDTMTQYGYTGIFCAFLENEDEIKTPWEMDRTGKLNCYFDASVRCDSLSDLPRQIKKLKEWRDKYSTDNITLNTIKLFIDGTLASGNAGLLEPLSNDPEGENYGTVKMSYDELLEYFSLCNENGLDVHIHCVGDRSFKWICDVVEELKEQGDFNITVVIAHCGIPREEDVSRVSSLGITLNLTPHWAGGMFGDTAIDYLGPERWARMGKWKSYFDTGATIALSSDTTTFYEFNRAYPFFGLQTAMTRRDIEYPLDPEKYPDSKMPPISETASLDLLIEGYTLGSAKQMHIDHKTGSLKIGKNADFLILSENCMNVPYDKINDIKVEQVYFKGSLVHRAV